LYGTTLGKTVLLGYSAGFAGAQKASQFVLFPNTVVITYLGYFTFPQICQLVTK